MATAIFTALASTSITVQAQPTNWYFGPFNKTQQGLTFLSASGSNTQYLLIPNSGNPSNLTGLLSFNGLALSSGSIAPDGFSQISSSTTQLHILNIGMGSTKTLNSQGISISGSFVLSEAASQELSVKQITVLDLYSSGSTINNTVNAINIDFEVVGASVTGINTSPGTIQSSTADSILVKSTGGTAQGLVIGGSYTGSKGLTVSATSVGGSTASALTTGPAAGTFTINGGLIDLQSELATSKPTASIPASTGYSSTGVSFKSTTGTSYIGSSGSDPSSNENKVSIGATLNISDANDLTQASGDPVDAYAYGVLMNAGSNSSTSSVNILAGSVAGNIISAEVINNGAAVTSASTVGAYAVYSSNGTVNINLAAPKNQATGATNPAVLDITASNNTSINDKGGNAIAAAVYAFTGGEKTTQATPIAGKININSGTGTVNISATALNSNGSQAFGVYAAGPDSAVNLSGKNMTITVEGGADNVIFQEGQAQSYVFSDDFAINNAAIYVGGTGATITQSVATVTTAVENLNVTGNVVAVDRRSAEGSLAAQIVFSGYNAGEESVSTNTIINGNLYSLNGASINVGAFTTAQTTGIATGLGTTETTDVVTVTGGTYIVGELGSGPQTGGSQLYVSSNATYNAQGETVVAGGGKLTVAGTYNAQENVLVSNQTSTQDAPVSTIVVAGPETGATMTVAGITTLTQGGLLNVGGQLSINGTEVEGAINGTYNAYGDLIVAKEPTVSADGKTYTLDSATVTIGNGGTLNIGDGTNTATATVNLGGSITGEGTMNVASGSTLALITEPILPAGSEFSPAEVPARITSDVVSHVYGTVQILGSSLPASTTEQPATPNYYQGGLGAMTIEDGGSVTGDDNGLYLALIEGDELTFAGGSMKANSVQVGIGQQGDEGATLTIQEGGEVQMLGNLIVGDTLGAKGTVSLEGGTLTLADPTPAANAGDAPTSSLTIYGTSKFSLSGDGTLVTNSQNLWNQAASEVIVAQTNPLQNNIGQKGTITVEGGGFLELTDSGVEASWLQEAQKTQGDAVFEGGVPTFIIDGQLLQAGKNVQSVLPVVPSNSKVKDGTLGYMGLMPNGGILGSTALNATTQPFTSTDGKTTTTYQNLVIGGDQTTKTPWTQPTGTVLWNINPNAASNGVAGFSSVQLGDNGNILVTGGDTLVLTGTGLTNEIVTGTGVTIYVNGNSDLILGGSENIAKGGTLNGNINVINGGMEVQYGEYTVNGSVTLGVAKSGSSATGTATSATPGSLEVANGTLNVQSIAGNNVESISIISGTLHAGELSVDMVNNEDFTLAKEGNLIVDQNLTLSAAGSTAGNPTVTTLSASESDIQVGGAFLATDTNIELNASSLTVTGDLTQKATRTTQASDLTLDVTNKGETVSTVKVGGDFSTVASSVTIENSIIEVTGDFSINGQLDGKATEPTTTVQLLDGAQITAANINITNAYSGVLGTEGNYYQDGNISTAGTIALNNSDIELHNGSLNAGNLQIDKDSDLTLGLTDLTDVNTALTAADLPAIDTAVVEASIGPANVLGSLTIGGTAPAEQGQTEVAIGYLSFDTTDEGSGDVLVNGQAALVLGGTDVEVLDTLIPLVAAKAPEGAVFTNYLVAGQTVKMGDNNSFVIGTDAQAQPSGLNIGAGTAVAVDAKSIMQSNQAAPTARGANQSAALFSYEGTSENAPDATINNTAFFLITNPVGEMQIEIAQGFDTEGITVYNQQLKTTNPLYTAQWVLGEDETGDGVDTPVSSNTIGVTINETAVRNDLNTIAPNTIIDSARNFVYGQNEGADRILDIISDITDEAQYPEKAALINSIALRGAAAHAHEIGISAASMVIDSVWDHTSKLAAAPHEEAKADLWITLDWNHSRANDYKAAGLDNGYKLDLYGATFGADYDFANGLAAGLAVSVGGGEAKSKGYNAGQKTDVTYWGINLYGTYTSPIVNVIGNVGYIGIKNKTKIGSDKGRPDANIWTIGVKAEKDFAINEQFTVTPHVGIRYLSVDVDDFNLQGFHYGTDKANLVQFPIGVAFAANLKTANGASVKPFLDLSFVPTAGDKNVNNTFGIQGGTMSDTIDTTIASGAMFQGKIGVNASYGAHNFGLNFAIGGGNKGRLDTGLQAKYRFVF